MNQIAPGLNFTLLQAQNGAEPGHIQSAIGPLSSEQFTHDAPEEHWLCLDDAGVVRARSSLWWQTTPLLAGESTGFIGHYAAADGVSGKWLIAQLTQRLRERGCRQILAPIDGNTWRNYRFVTEPGTEPPFVFEPNQPPEWPEHFRSSGFSMLAEYTSALNDNLAYEDPAVAQAWQRLQSDGVRIRPLQIERLEDELKRIHELTLASFASNLLFTPVSFPDFRRQYAALLKGTGPSSAGRPVLEPSLILLAERDEQCIGYVFMLPNLLEAQRGEPITTAVLKTVAVFPGRAQAGLGVCLVAHSQMAARQHGFRRVIHALMHDSNHSRNISRRFARTIRRYALFSKRV